MTASNPRAQQHTGIRGIHHVGLSVTDLAAAQEFYQGVMPLQAVSEPCALAQEGPPQGTAPPDSAALLRGPNAYLALQQFPAAIAGPAQPMPVSGPGVTHVCYQCPVTHDLYSQARAQQAQPVSRGDAPVDLAGRGVYYAYLRDASQLMFELEQLDTPHFEGDFWVAHVALVSPDIEALVAFYEKLLGCTTYNTTDLLRGSRADRVTGIDQVAIRAAWFNVGNMVFELWQYLNPVTPEPDGPLPYERVGYNKFVFEVADLDAECARLAAAGVSGLSEPVNSAEGRMVFGRDPDQNLYGLMELAAGSKLSLDRMPSITWM